MTDKLLCIYHANCLDGFAAAGFKVKSLYEAYRQKLVNGTNKLRGD